MISGSFFPPESPPIKSSKSILSLSLKKDDKSTSPSPESEEKKSSISIETSPSGSADFGAGISLFSNALKSMPGISKPSGKPVSTGISGFVVFSISAISIELLTIEEFTSAIGVVSIRLLNSSSMLSICSFSELMISSSITDISEMSVVSAISGISFISGIS